jgi:hypothetical protein
MVDLMEDTGRPYKHHTNKSTALGCDVERRDEIEKDDKPLWDRHFLSLNATECDTTQTLQTRNLVSDKLRLEPPSGAENTMANASAKAADVAESETFVPLIGTCSKTVQKPGDGAQNEKARHPKCRAFLTGTRAFLRARDRRSPERG